MEARAPSEAVRRTGAASWRRRLARGLLAGLCLVVPTSAPHAAPLEVTIGTSAAFDAGCALLGGAAIDPRWRAELAAMLPAARAGWSAQGRPLLDRAFELAGRELHGRHDVRLTLCDIPSSSLFGATVNMRHALPAFTDHPVPLGYKLAVADHELLHRLLAGVDLADSALLAAQAEEPWRVRRHLHLFALMKAALIDLGREPALAELVAIDSRRLPSWSPSTAGFPTRRTGGHGKSSTPRPGRISPTSTRSAPRAERQACAREFSDYLVKNAMRVRASFSSWRINH